MTSQKKYKDGKRKFFKVVDILMGNSDPHPGYPTEREDPVLRLLLAAITCLTMSTWPITIPKPTTWGPPASLPPWQEKEA